MSSINFFCDLAEPTTALPHFWEHTVGSDHAPMALRADWREQLKRCHRDLGFEYVRFHGLLSDDMGTVVRSKNSLLYSFFNIDQVFDFLLSIGMKPFVELSFMPSTLASGNRTVFNYKANVTPPADYKQWSALITRLVRHWVDRYGKQEVREWFFEVWNEPNLKAFWTGSQRDYFKLYKHTVAAIKKIDASLRVGGPATAKSGWVEEFVDFCERNKVPADFVSTHQYPTDALGSDEQDTEVQLYKSQRGIMRQQAQDTRRRARGRPVYYTEWNSSSNPRDPLHDEPYAAAFAVSTIMESKGLVEGFSFWTFSDLFEENYFPSIPFHGGFGLLNLHGIPKPTYRAFELLHQVGNRQWLVDGLHETVDCSVIGNGASLTILLTNHTTPGHSIETEDIDLRLDNASRPVAAGIRRIDAEHANPKVIWDEMGQPEYLTTKEVDQLEAASQLVRKRQSFKYRDNAVLLKTKLPAHGVAAITISFEPQAGGVKI
ncbi:MAG TPA: cellulase family glycosylhydrolase [Pyrinomonadaceae bacterium]|nr:cellulase family glycosylhydrolase [Pyrinomonadaceae bacterium]